MICLERMIRLMKKTPRNNLDEMQDQKLLNLEGNNLC